MPGSRARPSPLTKKEAQAARSRWGVPDWRAPKEYTYIKNLKGDRLRWEFLRRTKNYRQMWETKSRSRSHHVLGEFIDPRKRGDELPEKFAFRSSTRRGGPICLEPPDIELLLYRPGEEHEAEKNVYSYMGWQYMELVEAGHLILCFDPMRPTGPQLKNAGAVLSRVRKRQLEEYKENNLPIKLIKRTPKLKEPIKLLRVLDAYNEGVSDKKIGHQIYNVTRGYYSDAAATGNQHLNRALRYARDL